MWIPEEKIEKNTTYLNVISILFQNNSILKYFQFPVKLFGDMVWFASIGALKISPSICFLSY